MLNLVSEQETLVDELILYEPLYISKKHVYMSHICRTRHTYIERVFFLDRHTMARAFI